MDDSISRQAAIRWIKTECNPYGKPTLDFESGKKVIKHLEQMPSAQPERKKGKWFNYQDNTKIVLCSECRMPALESMTGCLSNQHLAPNRTNFCPNCGADMRGEKNNVGSNM